MKLLITTDNFLPRWDGIARFLNEMLPRLKGYDVTVIAPDYGPIRPRGFTLIQIPLSKRSFGDYTLAKYDPKTIEKHIKEADIVFNQSLGPIGIASIRAAKKHKKPILSFVHSIEWELFPRVITFPILNKLILPATKLFVNHLYKNCTALIVPSDATAEKLSWQGVRTQKRVAHLGVDLEKFTQGNKLAARKQLGLPKDAYIIGYHGRIAPEKNLFTLLRAFTRLDIPNKYLLLVGDGPQDIKKKFRRKDTKITGMQEDVRPYLHAMDVYVLPSFTETTSLSVLEAMASGLVVISSKVGFIREYITNGKNGFFFKLLSPYDLSKKIMHVHSLSHDDRLVLRIAARSTVEKRFRWDDTAKKIKLILEEFSTKNA